MTMKIAGMAIIFTSCTVCGILMGTEVQWRITLMKEFLNFFDYIIDKLKNYNYPIEKIFTSYQSENSILENSGFLTLLVKSGKNNGVYKNTWCETLETLIDQNNFFYSLENEEIKIIKAFAENLGMSNTETQLSVCNMNRINLHNLYEEKREELREKAKIYKISGSLVGMFICILMI